MKRKKRKHSDLAFNKKGNMIIDSLTILVFIVLFAIITIIIMPFFNDINNDIQNSTDMNNQSKEVVQDVYNTYPSIMDSGFILFFVLLWILVIVASFNIEAHPIFLVISIIALTFIVIVAALVTNVYEETIEDPDIITYQSSFPMTVFVMGHLPYFIIAVAFSILIALFGKNQIQ